MEKLNSNQLATTSTSTLEAYVYRYGESLMTKKIDTCPIEIFKPQSNFYQSITRNIDELKNEISKCERELLLLDENKVAVYVEQNFDNVFDEEDRKIEEKLKEMNKFINEHEEDLNEEDLTEFENLKRYRDHLPEIIEERLKNQYYKENNIDPEMFEYLNKHIIELERAYNEEKLKFVEWKTYCLDKAKEEEKQKLVEYLSIPHSNKDVIDHLNEFIDERINFNYTELLDEYYGMFEDLFDEVSKEKYHRTIKNVFTEQSSTKVIKAFVNHNQIMMNRLKFIVARIQFNESEAFELIEQTLKKSFEKFISDHFMSIYQFLRKSIRGIKSSCSIFENSTALKNFARSLISEVNQILIRDLPTVLESKFNDYVEDLMEKLGVNEKENEIDGKAGSTSCVKPNVKTLSLNLESFIETLPETEMDIKELTEMYNNYMGASISTRSFGMMKGVKESFTKRSEVVKGKRITYYSKA